MTGPLVIGHDVVVRFGSVVALAASSFEIPAGRITALIGPNGSGKSTLLSAIAGLIDPWSGSIEQRSPNGGQLDIAYVLQGAKVNETLPISVGEVVTMGRYASTGPYGRLRRADRAAVADAMARTGVSDLANRHLYQLSAGQRQRVFVAQGLAQEHDLLLLDEPLTGLDLPSAHAIDEVVHGEQSRGGTVVVSTHDLSEARVADHVLLLGNRVVAAGRPDDVLTPDLLNEAYGPHLLHIEGEQLFLDDPAHRPVAGRHIHRDRTIHVEPPGSEQHGEP